MTSELQIELNNRVIRVVLVEKISEIGSLAARTVKELPLEAHVNI